MIKTSRNALLACAIASLAACGGDSENETPDEFAGDLVGSLTGPKVGNHQTIAAQFVAQLLGGALYSLIETTSQIGEVSSMIENDETSLGNVTHDALNGDSASGIGLNLADNVCSKEIPGTNDYGNFDLKLLLNLEEANGGGNVVPTFQDGFDEFTQGILDVSVGLQFNDCNEPAHTDYNTTEFAKNDDGSDKLDANGNPIPLFTVVTEDTQRVYNGFFGLDLRSTPGDAANPDDFSFTANVNILDFSVQANVEDSTEMQDPYVLSAGLKISLKTTDNTTFLTTIGGSISNTRPAVEATADKDARDEGFIKTTITAKGEMSLEGFEKINTYDLSLSGSVIDYDVDSKTSFNFYTTENIETTGSDENGQEVAGLPVPERGVIALLANGTESTAVVTADGLNVTAVDSDNAETLLQCSWKQIEEREDCSEVDAF